MSVNPIESGTGNVWRTKQTALGTIEPSTATTMKALRKTGDDGLKAAKTLGSEEFVDGQAWGSPSQYIDAIGGDVGAVSYQAQLETAGYAFAQCIGVDVVTGSAGDFTHTIASGTANGPYQTYYQQTGQSVGPMNMSFWDALINTLTWNCGQDQKTARLSEGVMALHAANWFDTAPVAAVAASDPFNWNEVTGAVTVNGSALPEADGDTVQLDRKLDVHRGDSAAPVTFVRGKGEINRTISAIVTDGTLPQIKTILYGTAAPADGAAVSTAPSYAALKTVYTKSAVRSLSIDTPKVAVNPGDFETYPRAAGGKIPVTFGGLALKNGGTPAITVIAKTGDPLSYV